NIEEILNYVKYTSYNTNRAVLETLIKSESPEPPEPYVTIVDVSNYTAPNSTPTAQTNLWIYENLVYEVEGVLADGVPVTVNRFYTANDTDICFGFDDFVVELHGRDDNHTFTSTIIAVNPPNEVTFERLIIK